MVLVNISMEALLYKYLNVKIPTQIEVEKGKLSILELKEYGFRKYPISSTERSAHKIKVPKTINELLQTNFYLDYGNEYIFSNT